MRGLAEELRSFNVNADHRIRNVMSSVVDEEQSKQAKELNELKIAIRSEEEEINRLGRKNQETLQKLQNAERDGKNRLISKRNENTRLKEDLNAVDGQFNKLFLQLNNDKKEIDKKRATAHRMENELEELNQKIETIERKYGEEVEALQMEQNEEMQAMESDLGFYREEQNRLAEDIRRENDRIMELNQKKEDLIADIESNLNNTINKHGGYKSEEREERNIVNSRYNY